MLCYYYCVVAIHQKLQNVFPDNCQLRQQIALALNCSFEFESENGVLSTLTMIRDPWLVDIQNLIDEKNSVSNNNGQKSKLRQITASDLRQHKSIQTAQRKVKPGHLLLINSGQWYNDYQIEHQLGIRLS